MKYRTRIYYTEEPKALMWDRWQRGDSLATIACLFDRQHSPPCFAVLSVCYLPGTVVNPRISQSCMPPRYHLILLGG
jgi:hypothetical protein